MEQKKNVVESPKQEIAKYELVVKDAKNNIETKYALEEGKEIIVGADPVECPVFLDDEYASKRHFSIMVTGDKVEVQDLGSKNGLFLLLDNGTIQITPGQTLLSGKTTLKLETRKNEQQDKSLPRPGECAESQV